MSDLLTHWAVFDDCRRLAQHDPRTEPLFARLLDGERDAARLGALTRGGSRWVPAILARARERWSGTPEDPLLAQKLAFALGGVTHFAADAVLKPLMSARAGADWNTTHRLMQGRAVSADTRRDPDAIREISAYYDVHVFREVYLSGEEEPFSAFLLAANGTAPGQALEAFARALFQRALLSAHTLDPDRDDVDGWLDRLFARVQPLYVDIDRYVRVFERPDPEMARRFGVEDAFYRADDPLVRLARAAQRGKPAGADGLDAALADGVNLGGYGRALALGMARLRTASAYWRGEMGEPPDLRQ